MNSCLRAVPGDSTIEPHLSRPDSWFRLAADQIGETQDVIDAGVVQKGQTDEQIYVDRTNPALVLGIGLLADPKTGRHLLLGETVLFPQTPDPVVDVGRTERISAGCFIHFALNFFVFHLASPVIPLMGQALKKAACLMVVCPIVYPRFLPRDLCAVTNCFVQFTRVSLP